MKIGDARLCMDCDEVYKPGVIIGSFDTTKSFDCPACGGKQFLLLSKILQEDRVLISDTDTILSLARKIKEQQMQDEISNVMDVVRSGH